MKLNGRGRTKTGSSIHRAWRGIDTRKAIVAFSVLWGEGDKEGDKFFTNLEDRDKETDVPGGSLRTPKNGADFPLGPRRDLNPHPLRDRILCPVFLRSYADFRGGVTCLYDTQLLGACLHASESGGRSRPEAVRGMPDVPIAPPARARPPVGFVSSR